MLLGRRDPSKRGCPRGQGASGTSHVGRGLKKLSGDAQDALQGTVMVSPRGVRQKLGGYRESEHRNTKDSFSDIGPVSFPYHQ